MIADRARVRSIIIRTVNILLVYYLLSQINLADLKTAFLGVYIPALVIGLVIMFCVDFFKAYRQQILVASKDIRFIDMFLVSLIRNAFNMVLPARTGELSYVYVLKRKFKIPIGIGVSTLMIGLIFDLIIVFSMIVIAIIIVGLNRYDISSTAVIIIAIALLAASLVLLFFLSKFVGLFVKLCNWLLRKYNKLNSSKVFMWIYDKLVETNDNIKVIQKRKVYWKVYLLSVATRIMKFTSYYFLIYATMQPMGYVLSDLSYWVIFLATVAAELSAVLPTHALAGFGTYEGAFALAFIALGFSKELSIIVGFNYHIYNLLFTISWGIIAMIIISLPFYKARVKLREDKLKVEQR